MYPLIRTSRTLLNPPRWPFACNLDSPQCQGLIAWLPMSAGGGNTIPDLSLRKLLGERHGITSAAYTFKPGPGAGEIGAYASTSEIDLEENQFGRTDITWPNKISYVTRGYLTDISNHNPGGIRSGVYATAQDVLIWRGSTNAGRAEIRIGGTKVLDGTSDPRTPVDIESVTVWGYDTGRYLFFTNGQFNTGTHSLTPAGDIFKFWGTQSDPLVEYPLGWIYEIRVYDRLLSVAECWQLYDPPTKYDLYYELGRRTYFIPSAGGVSIAVPLGTNVQAGQVPTVSTGVKVSVPVGANPQQGYIPAVGSSVAVSVPVGANVQTGQAPAVSTGVKVSVPVGANPQTGLVPVISTGVKVSVPVGANTQQGYVPTVGGGVTVTAPLGANVQTGYVPTVSTGVKISAPVGANVQQGYVPTISTSEFTAPTVDAGGPYQGENNEPIFLAATVTPGSDPSPTILWEIQSGGAGSFSDDSAADSTFSASVIGTYVLKITVTPNDGDPVTDTATLISTKSRHQSIGGGPGGGRFMSPAAMRAQSRRIRRPRELVEALEARAAEGPLPALPELDRAIEQISPRYTQLLARLEMVRRSVDDASRLLAFLEAEALVEEIEREEALRAFEAERLLLLRKERLLLLTLLLAA